MSEFNPAESAMRGLAQGLATQQQAQTIQQQAAQEQRSAQMHPLQMQAMQLGLDNTQQGMQFDAAQEQRNAQKFQLEQQQAQQQAEQQARMQSALGGLAKMGKAVTAEDYARVATEFPELTNELSKAFEMQETGAKEAKLRLYGQAYAAIRSGNTQVAIDMVNKQLEAAKNSGNQEEIDLATGMKQLVESSPEAAMTALGVALSTLGGDKYTEVLGSGRVQSTVPVGTGISVQTMTDGTTRVVDTATNEILTGEEARVAIKTAQDEETARIKDIAASREGGKLETQIDLGGTAAAAKKSGELTATAGAEAVKDANIINKNLRTIDEAIAAIDAGANAGAIAKYFPNITESSASLRNAMDRMGLDVVAGTTFGALSEAELALAMETAVPRNLDETQLRNWLVSRREAQSKAKDMLMDAASFLLDPNNTLKMWVDKNRAEKGGASQPASPAQATPSRPSYLRGG